MKQISLKRIISIAMKAVASFGIKESVLRHYRQVYDKLSRYFLAQSRMMYSVQLAEDFVKECKQQLENGICCLGRFKQTRRAVQLLKDYYYTGSIVWKQYSYGKKKAPENPAFVKLQENYISYLVNLGWKRNSIESADNYSRQFLLFIEGKGRRSVAEVKPIDVSQFFPQLIGRYQATSISAVASVLRSFISYIGKTGIAQAGPFLRAIPPTRCTRKRSIIPTITKEEGEAILAAQKADISCSQRDRAIILLALRTGLRSIDIINLKLSHINWRNDTISIVQQKTGEPLVLPLIPEVGNAIAAYIMYERPDSELPYVFLRNLAPCKQLTSHCWRISANAMKSACVRQEKGTQKGLRVFRHSLATTLLAEGVPVPIIASILGHSNKESTNIYLSVDEVHLKECALGLSGIEVTREELL